MEAKPSAHQKQPDVILVEERMPVMGALEVLTRRKQDERLAAIPVIVLTTSPAASSESSAYELGAANYIIKPCEPSTIEAAVKVGLGNAVIGAETMTDEVGDEPASGESSRPDAGELNRQVSEDQVRGQADAFLRSKFGKVRVFSITSIQSNVRNPYKDMWETWGTRMVVALGEADLSVSRLSSPRPVSFQLEIYISKDGREIAHTGAIIQKREKSRGSNSDKRPDSELKKRNSPN